MEELDHALYNLCTIKFDMTMLCTIIAQVARIQIQSGVAHLPSSRASTEEVSAFDGLLNMCKRGSILERMCNDFPGLAALHHRASHLLLYILLDSISEKPLLRNPEKRKKALEALQKASLNLKSVARKLTLQKS